MRTPRPSGSSSCTGTWSWVNKPEVKVIPPDSTTASLVTANKSEDHLDVPGEKGKQKIGATEAGKKSRLGSASVRDGGKGNQNTTGQTMVLQALFKGLHKLTKEMKVSWVISQTYDLIKSWIKCDNVIFRLHDGKILEIYSTEDRKALSHITVEEFPLSSTDILSKKILSTFSIVLNQIYISDLASTLKELEEAYYGHSSKGKMLWAVLNQEDEKFK